MTEEEEKEMRSRFREKFINYDIWIQEYSPKKERTDQLLFNINENLKSLAESLRNISISLTGIDKSLYERTKH